MNRNLLTAQERSLIWIPEVMFSNNNLENRLVVDSKAEMFVNRSQNDPKVSKYSDLNNALIYEGDLNPLVYTRTFSEQFECNFNLLYYPFDIQHCHMNLSVPLSVSDQVQLVASGMTYLGPRVLHQFEVVNTFLETRPNQAQFSMTFRRLYEYKLISVYIPTIFLLCISLIINYSSIEHFEVNIMVHLTTMLVMYTLLQAISITLPQVQQR